MKRLVCLILALTFIFCFLSAIGVSAKSMPIYNSDYYTPMNPMTNSRLRYGVNYRNYVYSVRALPTRVAVPIYLT